MPRDPGISFSEQALRVLLSCRRLARERLLREVERLIAHWNEPAALTVRDGTGRELNVSLLPPFSITAPEAATTPVE